MRRIVPFLDAAVSSPRQCFLSGSSKNASSYAASFAALVLLRF